VQINADFSQRVLVHSSKEPWLASPMPGVDRRMLDRIGKEVARATTIVRYAANSCFSKHVHTGGEEFIVLDGVFQDEHGDYPKGTYVRNPPTTSHSPRSDQGCVIFVKLWQFALHDRKKLTVPMHRAPKTTLNGLSTTILHTDSRETVRFIEARAGTHVILDAKGGVEIFVIEGSLTQDGDTLAQESWLRCPCGPHIKLQAGQVGAKIWIKTGHLPYAKAPPV